MSEPLKNEYGDVLTCDYCTAGAATHLVELGEHEKKPGLLTEYRLCDLCYGGSLRAHGYFVYGTASEDQRIEMVVARMLNVFRGTIGD